MIKLNHSNGKVKEAKTIILVQMLGRSVPFTGFLRGLGGNPGDLIAAFGGRGERIRRN